MKNWLKVLLATSISLSLLLGINEYFLIQAGHLKTIVSDEALWAIQRARLDELDSQDIVLLGASRMQVDMDLSIMEKHLPGRRILQLALSGRGSAFPVLKDIVETTNFNGIIVLDETQLSLSNPHSAQAEVVDFYHQDFSIDKMINKRISMWLQQQFLFLNPNSNSERLWGNLLGKGQLPQPMFTMTYPTREQTSFFDITDTEWIYQERIAGVRREVQSTPIQPNKWLEKLRTWTDPIKKFQKKGGQLILIHMPLSTERWELENPWMPKTDYWEHGVKLLESSSIHFADYPSLNGLKIPDTSHLSAECKPAFSREFSLILMDKLMNK